MDLKANTAVDVLIGPFLDIDDGNTTEESLTIEDEHVLLSKNGQGLTDKNDTSNAAHDLNGYYNCPLNDTDTNEEGNLVLVVHFAATALPVRHEFNILAEAAWDSLYAVKDTGFMDINVKAINELTAPAIQLALSAQTIVTGTVHDAVAPSTTVFEADDITTAAADHYNGRIIIFTSSPVALLQNQATTIEDYRLLAGRGEFTVTALTAAPAADDTFIII